MAALRERRNIDLDIYNCNQGIIDLSTLDPQNNWHWQTHLDG